MGTLQSQHEVIYVTHRPQISEYLSYVIAKLDDSLTAEPCDCRAPPFELLGHLGQLWIA